jgi:uncharacterized protein YggE
VSEPEAVVLSVQAEAHCLVEPDDVVLRCSVEITRATKRDALHNVGLALEDVLDGLRSLGGVVDTVETAQAPITWSAGSISTYPSYRDGPDGRRSEDVVAQVALTLVVRSLDRLDQLGDTLARQEFLRIGATTWRVDRDNPVWPEVRADAIQAAIAKGRDYAAALGGTLVRVEHVADLGLLAGGLPVAGVMVSRPSALMARGPEFNDGSPTLDPVPQELVASVEARFVAAVPALG